MNPVLAQWLPTILMVLAIWVNKRLDDFKDLVRAEIGRSEERILARMTQLEQQLRAEIAATAKRLAAEIQALDRHVQRLEAPLLRS